MGLGGWHRLNARRIPRRRSAREISSAVPGHILSRGRGASPALMLRVQCVGPSCGPRLEALGGVLSFAVFGCTTRLFHLFSPSYSFFLFLFGIQMKQYFIPTGEEKYTATQSQAS